MADFIGRANFVPATIRDRRNGARGNGVLTVDALGASLVVPAPDAALASGADVTLVVRPEMVAVDAAMPHAHAVVRRAAYLGSVVEYDLEIAGQLLTVAEHDPRHGQVHPEGASVPVRLLEDVLYVLPE